MTILRRAAPIGLTVLGFAGIGGVWVRRAVLAEGMARWLVLGAGAIYGGWLVWESRVSRRDATRPVDDADKGTMEVAAAAKITLLLTTLLATSSPSLVLGAAGLVVMIVGATLRVRAVRALGERYSHRIRPIDPPVVRAGPYALVRHPAYLGTWLAHAGLVLVMPSAWSGVALFFAWLPAVVLRVEIEDRFLRGSSDYAAYAADVRKKLIPGVY